MKHALISTAALTLSLLLAGAGIAAAAESPSPSASPSTSDAPAPGPDAAPALSPSLSPSASPSAEPSASAQAEQLPRAVLRVPTYTCDTDPTDDFVLPEDTEDVTYTLEDSVFVATLTEGYEWDWWFFSDPWDDPGYDNFEPGFRVPEVGPTDQIRIPVADMAFPNCNHNDETRATLATECTDGMGYLVYDIDAPWATGQTRILLAPFTADEASGRDVYDGTGLSGRLAWDGSTPGMTGPIDVWFGTDVIDPSEEVVNDPIFRLSHADPSGSGIHRAVVKVDFQAADPCAGDNGGNGDGAAGGDKPADDGELAATGPEAAWLTTGFAALLVAAGAVLVVVRRRMNA